MNTSTMPPIETADLLYATLFDANPDAEVMAFRAWVCAEVLPAVLDGGGYLLNPSKRETAKAANWYTWPDGGRLLDRSYHLLMMEREAAMEAASDESTGGVLDI